jgi:hypothetical protein
MLFRVKHIRREVKIMCYCIGDCSCAENRYNYFLAVGILNGIGPPISVEPPDPQKFFPEGLVIRFATVEDE